MANTLWDHIVETRFFDNNGISVDDENNATIFIAHTTGNYFGDTWFAVSGIGGHQYGSEKTPELALLWGMKKVISDNAAQRNIRFERGEIGIDGRRYIQHVIIDGEHRATFKPNSFGVEYDLVDLEKHQVTVHSNSHGYGRYAQASLKANMEEVVRRWFEFIPTDKQLEDRRQQKAAEEERQRIEQEKEARRSQIRSTAQELYAAAVRAKAEFDRMFQDVEMSTKDRHSFIPVINELNAIIHKARGAS